MRLRARTGLAYDIPQSRRMAPLRSPALITGRQHTFIGLTTFPVSEMKPRSPRPATFATYAKH